MNFPNRHITTIFLCTISISLVASCSFKVERLDQPLVTIPPPATLPVSTEAPAPSPTRRSISTATASPAVGELREQECIPVEEEMPDNVNLSGIWVRNRGRPYLEPVQGGTAYGIPLKGGGAFSTSPDDMAVSPDGKHLAYIDSYLDEDRNSTQSRILRVINSSGRSLSMDYWITNWQWLIGWMDNQHLAIFTGNKEFLVLEPFTGKWEKLPKPSWLDDREYDYSGYQGPFYSPSLKHVLAKPDYSSFELKDFRTGETLYTGNERPMRWGIDWSADSSVLAVGWGQSLKVIRENQEIIALDTTRLGFDQVDFPKLSPDGKKLTFTSMFSGKLFVLDIERSEVRKLCTDEFNFWMPSVWSPDSRFVVQEAEKSYADQFDILIDIQQMHAYKLVSGRYQHRLVWLAEQ
jgi:hypothetical protein